MTRKKKKAEETVSLNRAKSHSEGLDGQEKEKEEDAWQHKTASLPRGVALAVRMEDNKREKREEEEEDVQTADNSSGKMRLGAAALAGRVWKAKARSPTNIASVNLVISYNKVFLPLF